MRHTFCVQCHVWGQQLGSTGGCAYRLSSTGSTTSSSCWRRRHNFLHRAHPGRSTGCSIGRAGSWADALSSSSSAGQRSAESSAVSRCTARSCSCSSCTFPVGSGRSPLRGYWHASTPPRTPPPLQPPPPPFPRRLTLGRLMLARGSTRHCSCPTGCPGLRHGLQWQAAGQGKHRPPVGRLRHSLVAPPPCPAILCSLLCCFVSVEPSVNGQATMNGTGNDRRFVQARGEGGEGSF